LVRVLFYKKVVQLFVAKYARHKQTKDSIPPNSPFAHHLILFFY
jgi:hypothetical protein